MVVNKGVGLIVLLEIHFAGRSSVNIVFPLSGNAVCSPSVCVMKWSRSLYFVYSDIHMQRYQMFVTLLLSQCLIPGFHTLFSFK